MLGIEARSFCALSHPSSPTCILKYKSVTKLLLPSQTVEWHRLPPPTKAITPICRRGAVESWGTLLGVQKLQVDRHILSPPRWCLSCDHACQGPRQNGLLKRMPSNVLCPAHCRSRLSLQTQVGAVAASIQSIQLSHSLGQPSLSHRMMSSVFS